MIGRWSHGHSLGAGLLFGVLLATHTWGFLIAAFTLGLLTGRFWAGVGTLASALWVRLHGSELVLHAKPKPSRYRERTPW